MREKKWTPGPWFACHPKDLGMTVAKLDNIWVVKCDQPVEPGEHDAHLIAAAPDLVEALEEIVNAGTWYTSALEIDEYRASNDNRKPKDGEDLLKQALAALAKAYGETNHD